ncbi:hypothetical protein QBC44DRAFT_6479 [Cladorrhinum sp. PSN332]|nr:hypothetical protein QBC44DRAFT_6479 [Cladorrhinum sp. PSN332]
MTALGKRKSRASDDDVVDAQEALRRHFEARFKPIAIAPAVASRAAQAGEEDSNSDKEEEEDDDDDGDYSGPDSDDVWGGVSGDGDEDEDEDEEDDDADTPPTVEIVDHSSSAPKVATMSKKELKAYLSSRPPSHSTLAAQPSSSTKSKKASGDDDQPEDSAAFLANDLALQRLIAESHILSAAGGNASHWQSSAAADSAANTRAFAAGRTAKRTTDLRFQALGAKDSILAQAKMPMSMRKGIVGTATAKDSKRRREAKENGIILEREVKKQPAKRKKQGGRGERPVDAPGVGRLRGAQLTISAREARAISSEGVRRGGGGGGGKRRR